MQQVQLPYEVLQEAVNYLAQDKYSNVYQLIGKLQAATVIEEKKEDE